MNLDERDTLLNLLTGIQASKRNYYAELKAKVKELELNAQRLERALASLKSISQALTTTTRGVDALLQALVKAIARLFDAEYAVIMVGDEIGATRAVRCGCSSELGFRCVWSDEVDTESVVRCVYERSPEPMSAVPPSGIRNLAKVVMRQSKPDIEDGSAVAGEGRATLCVPMFREEEVVGTICLQSRQGCDFLKSDVDILQTLANQAAVAIENAELFEESQRLRAQAERLYRIALEQKEEAERKSRELESARNRLDKVQREKILSEERNRIARELHDSVAQRLTSIGLNLEWCRQQLPQDSVVYERLLSLKRMARHGVYEIRQAIFELSEVDIRELGLITALQKSMAGFQKITGIEAHFEVQGDPRRLPLAMENALYRIAQEALYNVFKHAQATRVDLEVSFWPEKVSLSVTDNGVGIPEHVIDGCRDGLTFGLKNMVERAQELQGYLKVVNLNGHGTRITATIPLRRAGMEVQHGHTYTAGG